MRVFDRVLIIEFPSTIGFWLYSLQEALIRGGDLQTQDEDIQEATDASLLLDSFHIP